MVVGCRHDVEPAVGEVVQELRVVVEPVLRSKGVKDDNLIPQLLSNIPLQTYLVTVTV